MNYPIAAGIRWIWPALFKLHFLLDMTPEEAKLRLDGIIERSKTELDTLLLEMTSSNPAYGFIQGII